jgi:hypothetical protein
MVFKRWDLLSRADRSSAEIAAEHQIAQAEWEAVNETVLTHPHRAKLERNLAKKLASNRERPIPEPLDAVWARAGPPRDLYDLTFRYLSQYAHATPYAVANLRFHQAGHEHGAVNMSIPVGLALPLVMNALGHSAALHPNLAPLLPPAFDEYLRHKA